jgi:hypothetical protein
MPQISSIQTGPLPTFAASGPTTASLLALAQAIRASTPPQCSVAASPATPCDCTPSPLPTDFATYLRTINLETALLAQSARATNAIAPLPLDAAFATNPASTKNSTQPQTESPAIRAYNSHEAATATFSPAHATARKPTRLIDCVA